MPRETLTRIPAGPSASGGEEAAMSGTSGWFPDPSGRHQQRWFDGTTWTGHVADGGARADDPLLALSWRGDRLDERSARANVLVLQALVRHRHAAVAAALALSAQEIAEGIDA